MVDSLSFSYVLFLLPLLALSHSPILCTIASNMASSRKTTKTNIKKDVEEVGFYFPRGYWLHFFLALLAAYSLYVVVTGISSSGYLPLLTNLFSLMHTGTSSLLIVVFSVFFLVYAVLKRSVPLVAKVFAYILVILAALALIVTFVITSRPHYSQDDFYLVFSVLYHNPWVAIYNSVTSIFGIVTLIVKLVQRNK